MGHHRPHYGGEVIAKSEAVFKSRRTVETTIATSYHEAPQHEATTFDAFAHRVATFRQLERAAR